MDNTTPQLALFTSAPHDPTLEIPTGYWRCGCGEKTPIATRNESRHGHIKGQPKWFVHAHHTRLRRTPPPAEHFWAQVKILGPDDCWEWQGGKSRKGYGHARFDDHTVAAHRVAWILTHGPIPESLQVLHKCDNPPCCNPAHLFLGTNADNMADKIAKNRQPHGTKIPLAKLNEQQVIEARQCYAEGGISIAALAREYGVNRITMKNALQRHTWRHVP